MINLVINANLQTVFCAKDILVLSYNISEMSCN